MGDNRTLNFVTKLNQQLTSRARSTPRSNSAKQFAYYILIHIRLLRPTYIFILTLCWLICARSQAAFKNIGEKIKWSSADCGENQRQKQIKFYDVIFSSVANEVMNCLSASTVECLTVCATNGTHAIHINKRDALATETICWA